MCQLSRVSGCRFNRQSSCQFSRVTEFIANNPPSKLDILTYLIFRSVLTRKIQFLIVAIVNIVETIVYRGG
jgi:hypothetical protein